MNPLTCVVREEVSMVLVFAGEALKAAAACKNVVNENELAITVFTPTGHQSGLCFEFDVSYWMLTWFACNVFH